MKIMITKRTMALLVLVTLSISSIQAQDNNWRYDNDKLVKLTSQGYEKVNYKYSSDDFNFVNDLDFSNRKLRRGLRQIRNDYRDFSVTRRDRRTINKKSIFERSWKDIDRNYPRRGTDNFVNVYLGLNQFIENEKLTNSDALYSLHPINSTYFAINFDNITRIFRPLYIEWGVGISYQDFNFENTTN